jgi:3-oxoacyl-[acyl-carrier protein] reductase
MRLDGKVAVVTGAAQGIGRAIAETLAESGASVVIGDLQEASATVAEIENMGHQAASLRMDVSRRQDAEALVVAAESAFGRLDILVNNAGIDAPAGDARDLSVDEWERTISVNLTGSFHCAQAALRVMLPQGSGSIVNVSSHASWLGVEGMSPAYNASKAGLIGLTVAFAVQLGSEGIRVNAVAPGAVRSPGDLGWTADETERHESLYTLGLGEPRDIAQAVRYLASPAARWVTGSVLHIHGGFYKGGPII